MRYPPGADPGICVRGCPPPVPSVSFPFLPFPPLPYLPSRPLSFFSLPFPSLLSPSLLLSPLPFPSLLSPLLPFTLEVGSLNQLGVSSSSRKRIWCALAV